MSAMYSMNYIGKFIANFREFYNEINGATLTGAIDVVVVEQPDGSFTCSPFHVRFGKLGVLRSRLKVVDLELNGEPLNIHMKLGESGEAFFVEEVGEDEEECSAHLATSPIPAGHFEQMYEPRRRNSLSAVEPDHGQASDYTKRRYTADAQSMQKPNISKMIKTEARKEEKKVKKPIDDHEELFEMEGLNEDPALMTWPESRTPKTFAATPLGSIESEATQAVQRISADNDFRPIEVASHMEENKQNGNGKKKKKTRKVGSKKKHQRKSSSSSVSSQSDRAGSEQRTPQSNALPSATDPIFFSDSEVNATISRTGEPRSPVQSDTEIELGRAGADSGQSWRWGQLPEPPAPSDVTPTSPAPNSSPASPVEPLSSDEERSSRRGVLSGMLGLLALRGAPTGEGVYLDELAGGNVDPDLYFPKHHRSGVHASAGPTEEEYESGNGPSLPQSPASLDPPTLDSDDDDKILAKGGVSIFVREDGASAVSRALEYEEFCARGAELLSEGRVLVRLGSRCLPWRSAAPMLLALAAYRRAPPQRMLDELEKDGIKEAGGATDQGPSKPRAYSWWSWRRTNDPKRIETSPPKDSIPPKESDAPTIEVTPVNPTDAPAEDVAAPELTNPPQTETVPKDDHTVPELDIGIEPEMPAVEIDENNETAKINEAIMNVTKLLEQAGNNSSSDNEDTPARERPPRRHSSFRKTLRLSSEQIKNLNLRSGMNEMVFSVTTAYQGTTRCKCNVFRWRHDDKIVISDIDGTITKSDVLGHIFPLVGKDWAQSGVAQLFTKIKNNGYQLLYLSARAIGQARVTREYLRSIRQGEVCLPDGPLLLNPTSLLRAFHREVIEKKPEEFKIQCLADIKALFPQYSNPFYAGYGNRVNDVCAYQAVGIPIVRIFTINYKGELKHELTQTFQSTYSHMSVLVDQVFPPALCEPCGQYSQSVYWRDPLPDVEQLPAILH